MVEQWSATLVVVFAVAYAIFQAQPPPPQSPLLYQWETMHAHRIKFGDHDIFYKDVDGLVNKSGAVLVLHGFPTSSFDFHLLLNSLRKTFSRVVFIDFLGHGFSDKPRNHVYTLLEQTNIVEHVLKKIQLSEFHILSHDYGGSVALELVTRCQLRHPRPDFSIKSLGIISPSMFSEFYRETWSMYLLRMPIIGNIVVRLVNRVWYAQELSNMLGRSGVDEFTLKQLWYFARYKDEYRAWPSILSYINERRRSETRWLEALQKARMPICLIHGPADPILPFQELATQYRKHIPHVDVEKLSENVGHYPQLEAPEDFFQKYAHFLRSKAGHTISIPETVVLMPKQSTETY